ncbi:uncharacterized protein (TIGR02453 family) [Maritalea mobilis]|uniref:Uncharacterized protein (TIGR02453 family) n=1 Tax=Maritalea mobilis TaxID=483324 RepID=A0A4R6VSA2_9HYPH|nr:DUF2461 domain-containing protein [Maritalea mobilis]TDQ66912.1 uncharacterized protein (TIGR02453 family) [Maritalea mobilis]
MEIEKVQAFLRNLDKNNEKAWFGAHKEEYQALIVAPLLDVVEAMQDELVALNPPLNAVPKINGSLRRIYRDTRFSKDKTPYNVHVHLVFWAGDHATKSPGTHIALHQDGYGYGAGFWALDKDQLAQMRAQIVSDEGTKIAEAVGAAEAHGVPLNAPQLKRVPSGFDAAAPYAEWLKLKGLVVRNERKPYEASIFNDQQKLKAHFVEICQQMAPVNQYLMEQVF